MDVLRHDVRILTGSTIAVKGETLVFTKLFIIKLSLMIFFNIMKEVCFVKFVFCCYAKLFFKSIVQNQLLPGGFINFLFVQERPLCLAL